VANPDSRNLKSELRESMRRRLHALNASSRPVCDALGRWLASLPGLRTIAVFSPLPGEVDLSEFVHHHPEIRWVYPRVTGDELQFHQISHPDTGLVVGAFGVREPSPTRPVVPAGEIDAIICPGLAFDVSGGRLGRGKGFYDRLLEKSRPDAHKIGVCFPVQIVPDTFSEAHDVHMDRVISG
jgi:5-formyltetrahydrofolate cyclo-ligase